MNQNGAGGKGLHQKALTMPWQKPEEGGGKGGAGIYRNELGQKGKSVGGTNTRVDVLA